METMKTTLVKKESWYNPYFLEGKKVDYIAIFDENGVIFDFKWLGSGSNNETEKLFFDFNIKRSIKTDYSRKDAFYRHGNGDGLIIYIPANLIDWENKGEMQKYKDIYGHSVYQVFNINVLCETPEYIKLKNGDYEKINSEPKKKTFTIEKYIRTEKTDKGKYAEEILQAASSVNVPLSSHQLEKLETILNISIK